MMANVRRRLISSLMLTVERRKVADESGRTSEAFSLNQSTSLIRMEHGCVADQPQQFDRTAADASRTAALRKSRPLGSCLISVGKRIMPPVNRATRSVRAPALLACLMALSFRAGSEPVFDESLVAQPTPWGAAVEELKPHQFVTPGAPTSPAKFNPDSGVKPGTAQPEVAPQQGLEKQRRG